MGRLPREPRTVEGSSGLDAERSRCAEFWSTQDQQKIKLTDIDRRWRKGKHFR